MKHSLACNNHINTMNIGYHSYPAYLDSTNNSIQNEQNVSNMYNVFKADIWAIGYIFIYIYK